MPLIKSISGIRGTIGGQAGDGLTPVDIVALTTAYGQWLQQQPGDQTAVIGRDARPSGHIVGQLVSAVLQSMGINVVDLGLSTTPTIALAVPWYNASGGIVISASHNPVTWNSLKLLSRTGELLDAAATTQILTWANQQGYVYASTTQLGQRTQEIDAIANHVKQVIALPLVDVKAIRSRQFRVVIDAVNSTGGWAVPQLLSALGVAHMTRLNCTPNGLFKRDPEPLPEHLTELIEMMATREHDIGFAVDPDVDRLAVVDEAGTPWGEEYTLVAAADYVLRHKPGNTVSNLSSTQALKDITERYGMQHTSAPVGEQHVVTQMKATQAVIGGEGNGGVIYPALHYGRDALVGIALLLTHLARTGQTASALRATYPNYVMVKEKISLPPGIGAEILIGRIRQQYSGYPMHTEDGIKLILEEGWIHLRQSNTEPIIRLYAEAPSHSQAMILVDRVRKQLSVDLK
ncbi:MAG: phosphoglucosamine mutase [Bacteroidota bacterium]